MGLSEITTGGYPVQYDDDENGSEMILIAEGHDALLGSLKDLVLTELPHASVLTVRSGKEAVKLSLARRLSAAILDCDLPDLSGVETTRQIHTERPDTSVVLIHEEESSEYRASAIEAGASGYVVKHRIATELVPVLKKLLPAKRQKNRKKGGAIVCGSNVGGAGQ
jgi:DNA-binding NarL/FixJ family response regulator